MRWGLPSQSSAARFSLQSPRPAPSVSSRCSSGLSGSASPSADAQVICAMMVAPPRPTTFLSSRITRAPFARGHGREHSGAAAADDQNVAFERDFVGHIPPSFWQPPSRSRAPQNRDFTTDLAHFTVRFDPHCAQTFITHPSQFAVRSLHSRRWQEIAGRPLPTVRSLPEPPRPRCIGGILCPIGLLLYALPLRPTSLMKARGRE